MSMTKEPPIEDLNHLVRQAVSTSEDRLGQRIDEIERQVDSMHQMLALMYKWLERLEAETGDAIAERADRIDSNEVKTDRRVTKPKSRSA